ncbi:MAG: glycosyltransferase [bacterium]|nr:glycosyltransferase [bacterium]
MKILIISNLYEPYARGGAEAVVKTTAEELVRRNHEVIVLTAGPAKVGLSPKESLQNGVRVLRFFPLNLYFVKDDWRFSKILRIFARLIDLVHIQSAEVVRRLLAKEQPDVVITHNLVGIGFLIPRVIQRWAKKNQRKAIHVLHDVQLIHPSGLLLWKEDARAQQNILRKLYEKIMRQLMGSPSIVISPSRWLLEFHNRRGFFPKSKTIILPNPINVFPTAKRLPVTDYPIVCWSIGST